ncbi:MAG TPA: hypothetical protein VHE13_10080 [Opitutus sp.]|nr:hypothetical protein [Opitutus sp.]
MAGYSPNPLWKKLGYHAGIAAHVVNAPPGYCAALALPADLPVAWLARAERGVGFVHAFVRTRAELAPLLADLRGRIAPAGTIWISWPKRASKVPTDVTEDVVRDLALPLGLVDIKVCAVDETWSGLKLVIRKTLRPAK